MAKNIKRLYRSTRNRLLAGVCGGIAEYFDADPTIVRLLYIVLMIFTGLVPLLALYLIMWVIVPEHP